MRYKMRKRMLKVTKREQIILKTGRSCPFFLPVRGLVLSQRSIPMISKDPLNPYLKKATGLQSRRIQRKKVHTYQFMKARIDEKDFVRLVQPCCVLVARAFCTRRHQNSKSASR